MEDLQQRLQRHEERGEKFLAIDVLEQIVEADPESMPNRLRLAILCVDTGQVARATSILQTLLDGGHEHPNINLTLGHALKALGEHEAAAEQYLKVAEDEADAVSAMGYWSLGNMKNFHFDDRVLTSLRDRIQHTEVGSTVRGLMLFALAAAWEQRENHEAAFMAMSEANLVYASQRPFRADYFGQLIHSICKFSEFPESLPPAEGPTPIFVVGMPRSGTTLVEQILASHSKVEATDELPFLNRIGREYLQDGGYAKSLAEMSAEKRNKLAGIYLDGANRYRNEGLPYFIDKMPNNFLHIGLIKVLFPHAKIVNLIRDPLDNAIGLFKMYFNEGADYSFSMDGIIYYWQGYVTLMQHWEKIYPGAIMHLSYEALAHEPDTKIRELLEYCGLEVEEQCFRFYESDRPVLTPSAGQVRSPISTKSIGSGQRYEQYIKTSIPALAEIKRVSREVFGID